VSESERRESATDPKRLSVGLKEPRELVLRKVALARLLRSQLPPFAWNLLAELEEALEEGSVENLARLRREGREQCWTHLGSLACYCSVTDSLSMQAVSACFEEPDPATALSSLEEQAARVERAGIDAGLVRATLEGVSP
jgi:hypothetical protein